MITILNDLCVAAQLRYTNLSNIYTATEEAMDQKTTSFSRNEYEKLMTIKTLNCQCCSHQCKSLKTIVLSISSNVFDIKHIRNLTTTIAGEKSYYELNYCPQYPRSQTTLCLLDVTEYTQTHACTNT